MKEVLSFEFKRCPPLITHTTSICMFTLSLPIPLPCLLISPLLSRSCISPSPSHHCCRRMGQAGSKGAAGAAPMDQKQISEKYNLTESQVQTLVDAFQKEAPKVHNIFFYYSPQHINTSTAHHTTSPPSTTHIPLVPLSYHHFTHHHTNSLLLKL